MIGVVTVFFYVSCKVTKFLQLIPTNTLSGSDKSKFNCSTVSIQNPSEYAQIGKFYMSAKITNQILTELSTRLTIYAQANTPQLDIHVRADIQMLMERLSSVLKYPWLVPLESHWMDVLMSDNLTWPDDIQNIEAYLDFVCEGYYRSFGYLFAFSNYEDSLRFQKKFQRLVDNQ